jgi:hypothetical protein
MSKQDTVPLNPPFHSHNAHMDGRQIEHDAARERGAQRSYGGNIDPRVAGKPKAQHSIKIHGGMNKVSRSGQHVVGAHAAEALDSLTGANVVPGNVQSSPGWGNGGVRTGGPITAHATDRKNLKAVAVSPGMRSRTSPHSTELGEAILQQAFRAGATDDALAHGRDRATGAKLPLGVKEN